MEETAMNQIQGSPIPQSMDAPPQNMIAAAGAAAADAGNIPALPFGQETPIVEIKLFVGRVPRTVDEDGLRPYFGEFGQVLEVAIIRDKLTQNHKGSAFVRMASITQADNAIRALNNVKVLDAQLGPLQVRYATGEAEKLGLAAETANAGSDQAKLFVGSLPKTISEEDVCSIFKSYGTIDEVFVMKDNQTGQGKGCAFVKFQFKEQALHAIKSLNGVYNVPGGPRAIEVRFAENKKPAAGSISPSGNAMMPAASGGAGMMGAGVRPPSNMHPRQAGPWKEYFTVPEGRSYYHHEITNQTQWERPPEFDQAPAFAMQQRQQDPTGPPGANIFVFHVPNNWGENELHQSFGCHGNIISARIATDRTTGRNKGYAFVSYDQVNSAVQAVHHMNGYVADGKRLKVSIKQHEEKYAQQMLNTLASTTPGGQGPAAAMAANAAIGGMGIMNQGMGQGMGQMGQVMGQPMAQNMGQGQPMGQAMTHQQQPMHMGQMVAMGTPQQPAAYGAATYATYGTVPAQQQQQQQQQQQYGAAPTAPSPAATGRRYAGPY